MAIFHFSAKAVSLGKGQSAIAKAAYNAREKIRDEQTGEMKNYTRHTGVVFSGIFAPKNAPDWANDRAALWNVVERGEKRKDAQFSREVTIGLPHELTDEQRKQLVTDFVREQFLRKGMVADVNIHAPGGKGDNRNHHAHILLTMREIGPEGFGRKVREWNSREQLEHWREGWERIQNRYLERYGHEVRVDRRTLEAQGIEREPGVHLGPHASAIERRQEIETRRGAISRDALSATSEAAKLKSELAQVQSEIRNVERGTDRPKVEARGADKRFQEAAKAATQKEAPAPTVANDNQRVGVVADKGIRKGIQIADSVFSVTTKALESIFAPPTPLTKEQIKENQQHQERAATQNAAAHEQEVSEADYDRTKQRWAEEAEKQRQQERKDYQRYVGDDRDRDRR